MGKLLERKLSLVFIILQFVVSLLLCIYLHISGVVPIKYNILIDIVFGVLLAYQVLSQLTNASYIIGRIVSIFICVICLAGFNFVQSTESDIEDIGGVKTKVDVINFYVLKEDPAQTLKEAKDYTYGTLSALDAVNTQKAVQAVETEVGQSITTKDYQDAFAIAEALYVKEAQVIILNQSYVEIIEDQYDTFSEDTRILTNQKIETEVEEEYEDTDVTTKPFNVYISGIDVYGDVTTTSRSDVNIIATVNPLTKKILLTSTPRDYYVPLYTKGGASLSGGIPDKLTHAGIYGVDCSFNTLEKLYDIDIDYYVRVNFSSLKKIVNLLGGVRVYSDSDFISDWGPNGAGTHYSFKKGYNFVYGKKALAFCRERHHFANGDYQRGRNHQHMIEAVLNKVMSPDVLTKFSPLLKESKNMFQTNMSGKKIKSLCRMQLNDMAQWKISYANAEGSGSKQTTFSIRSSALYVCVPNMSSVNKITKKINKIMNERPEEE